MNTEPSGLWWAVVVVTGAVSTGMVVYGIRQKDLPPLVFGVGLGLVPVFVSTGWIAAILSFAIVAAFYFHRKYL